MTALKGYADHVKAAVKAGADLIISGAGLPVDLPALTEGSAVKIAPIVSTARSAQVILKYWDKKYGRTADLIVAEGPLAGGHLGFTEAELDKWKGDAYHMEFGNILDVVRQYAKKYKCRIPVIAAGGIYDRSDVQRMEQLGADGVQVATRDCHCEKSGRNAGKSHLESPHETCYAWRENRTQFLSQMSCKM